MTSSTGRLRVVASTPITEDLIAEIVRAEPRIDFVRDQKLLPPQRFPGDHSGDPTFTRTAAEQSAFDALVDSAEVLYGVPDEKPAPAGAHRRGQPRPALGAHHAGRRRRAGQGCRTHRSRPGQGRRSAPRPASMPSRWPNMPSSG